MENNEIELKDKSYSSVLTKIIRFEIDGKWDAFEMAQFLNTVKDLYFISIFFDVFTKAGKHRDDEFSTFTHNLNIDIVEVLSFIFNYEFDSLPDFLYLKIKKTNNFHKANLIVSKINYSSPGVADLAGIGSIVGHIKDFILKMIEISITKEQRNLDNKTREIENSRKILENEQEKIEIQRKLAEVEKLQIENEKLRNELIKSNIENKILLPEPETLISVTDFFHLQIKDSNSEKETEGFIKELDRSKSSNLTPWFNRKQKNLMELIDNKKIRGVTILEK